MAIQNKIKGTLVSALTCKALETRKDLVLITRIAEQAESDLSWTHPPEN